MQDKVFDYLKLLEAEDAWEKLTDIVNNEGKATDETGGEELEDSSTKMYLQKKLIRRLRKL